MKKNFLANITDQVEKKEQSALENKVIRFETDNKDLRQKLKHLEEQLNNSFANHTKIKLSEVKLTENIRDEYEYEEIEQLALDILKNKQLQPIVLTKDNYLLIGYRRYNALQLLNNNLESLKLVDEQTLEVPDHLLSVYLDFNLEDLSREQIDEIQYSENNERRSLDNFQISKLFNKYLKRGSSLDEISSKFKKAKSFVSSLISLSKIDSQLVKWIKEFQIYAWSKKKLTKINLQSVTNSDIFYEKNRGIIGWKILYEIARQPDVASQKKIFLKYFKIRLAEEELNSEYFQEVLSKNKTLEEKKLRSFFKYTKGLSNLLKNIGDGLPEKTISELKINISQIENALKKVDTNT
jgi:hypothetical protein